LGYVSCNACHFVPTGGGMLSPYGQSVQSAMAAFARDSQSPEGKRLFGGFQARAIALDSTTRANPFLMQADALGTAYVGDKLHFDAIAGLALTQGDSGFAAIPQGWNAFVLRRALATYDLDDTQSVEAGRDAAMAGLNVEDHTTFLKTRNRRGIYDYPTQIRYIRQTEKLQLIPYLALPSFEEAVGARETAAGVRAEYGLSDNSSVGITGSYGNTGSISRTAGGAFFRLSQDHWNGFQGEAVFTRFNEHSGGVAFDQQDLYLRPYVAVPEWIETALVFEALHVSPPFAETGFQFGPSLNLRIHRYVSILADGRNVSDAGRSQWSWYGQIFFHGQI
jgi:hypothetical protein